MQLLASSDSVMPEKWSCLTGELVTVIVITLVITLVITIVISCHSRPDCAFRPVTLKLVGEVVSQPYIDMTLALMKLFGVVVDCQPDNTYVIPCQPYINPKVRATHPPQVHRSRCILMKAHSVFPSSLSLI